MESTFPERKTKRPRSPSYPGIGLEQAIERARELYKKESRNAAPIDAILSHWGYKPKSGAGGVVVAALKKFSLLDDEGSGEGRTARLTDLGLDIILAPEGSPERRKAIQQAAVMPGIHQELLEKFPSGLPSDETLIYYLTRDRQFTDGAARELADELRATLAFAGLSHAGDILGSVADDKPIEEARVMTPVADPPLTRQTHESRLQPLTPEGRQRAVQLPVPGTSWVTLQGEFPMTEEAWDQMIALLSAMKPGLVAAPAAPAAETPAAD